MSRKVLVALVACFVLGCPSSKVAQGPRAKRVAEKAGGEDLAKAKGEKEDEGAAQKARPVARKIVYTAELEVIVDDLDQASGAMLRLLEEKGGYVSRSDVEGTPGTPRVGTWTVRVPADRFT